MNKKKVRFNKATIFIFENIDEKISKDLWWSKEEYDESRKSAFEEINRLRSIHATISIRDALRLLYQPNNITYNEKGSIKYTDDYQYYIPEKHMYNAQKKEICFLKNRYYGNNYHGSSLTLIEIPKWLKSIIK